MNLLSQKMKTKIILSFLIIFPYFTWGQYQEGTIRRTTSTNSVFPDIFPTMTIRKMSNKEYWLFESLGTNTIFHRQFPTYIVRKSNYGNKEESYAVYRTTSTNSVFPRQFPDRYISSMSETNIIEIPKLKYAKQIKNNSKENVEELGDNKYYTYSKSLREDKRPAYSPE